MPGFVNLSLQLQRKCCTSKISQCEFPVKNQSQSLSQRVTKTSSGLQQLTGRPGPRLEDFQLQSKSSKRKNRTSSKVRGQKAMQLESRKDVGRREYQFAPALNIEIPSDKSYSTSGRLPEFHSLGCSPIFNCVQVFSSRLHVFCLASSLPPELSVLLRAAHSISLSLLLSLHQLLSLLPRSWSPRCRCLYPPLPRSLLLLLPRSTWKLPERRTVTD